MIGKRLKMARMAAGFTQRQLAERMGGIVTHAAITKYESDQDMPSSRVLIAMSRALNTRVDTLMSAEPIEIEKVEFRKKASTRKREIAQLEMIVAEHAERYLFIEDELGLSSSAWHRPNGNTPRVASLDDAESVAEWLRGQWDLGVDPIPNVVELIEAKGAKVLAHRLDRINGVMATVRHGQSITPFIVINSADSGERQRFTLAHELGHLVLEGHLPEDVDEESAAHRFAGAFLLPRQTVLEQLGGRRSSLSMGELFELKRIFSVSVQVIARRAMDVGVISQAAYTNLCRQFSMNGWRGAVAEPFPVAIEAPCRFRRLVMRAFTEDAISPAKAAELLRVPVRDLDRVIDEPTAAMAAQ